MTPFELCVALVVAVGLVGVLVPVLPGSALVVAAVAVWALVRGTTTGWLVLALVVALVAAGAVAKYAVPGRRLQRAGIPSSTQWWGALGGLVGFFVVPVVGLLIGFVLGVYVAERRRVGAAAAWPSTRHALRAAGLSLLIELVAALLAAGVWVAAVTT